MDHAGDGGRWIPFEPEDEVRAGENDLETALDAGFEPAFAPAGLVERQDRLELGIGHRPAEGTPGQRRQDPPGARRFRGPGGRLAEENPAPARRVSRTGGFEGSTDGDRLDV